MLDFPAQVKLIAVVLAPAVAASLPRVLMIPALRCGLVDRPGHPKVHEHPTPLFVRSGSGPA